jgi:hypothetical protein
MKASRFSDDKTRFTLWLSTATIQQVERVQRSMDKATVAEVIRDAVEVYLSLLKARDRGVRLYFQDDKTGESGRIWLLPGPPPV